MGFREERLYSSLIDLDVRSDGPGDEMANSHSEGYSILHKNRHMYSLSQGCEKRRISFLFFYSPSLGVVVACSRSSDV